MEEEFLEGAEQIFSKNKLEEKVNNEQEKDIFTIRSASKKINN